MQDCYSGCNVKTDIDPGFEEQEKKFIAVVCGSCPHSKPRPRQVERLLHYVELQDNQCPLERHELLDEEWKSLNKLRAEWNRLEEQWIKTHPDAKPAETDD